MAPFVSTHKLKPAQGLNHSSCNRLFRYRLIPHILKCNAFPELAGDGDFSDGTELRGEQDHKFKNALWISSFLWSWGKQQLVSPQALLSFLGRAASVPPPQLWSRYLGSSFPCHFPFPPVARVCSLQLGNPCDTFHWQTPQSDAEQLNLFNQFLKMAYFLCPSFGTPDIQKSRSLTKHFTLTCLNRTKGFWFFFFSHLFQHLLQKRAGVVSVKHPSMQPPDRTEP